MTFKNDITNDLDIFFDDDEFATEITFNSETILGIFDNEFAVAVEGEMGIESTAPQVLVKDADITGAAHGQIMTIDGTDYKIIAIQPDGTGTTVVLLSED